MIRINLLPVRAARKKESVRLQLSVFSMILFAVLLLMAHFWMSMNATIADLQGRIEVAQTYLQKYQKEIREAEKIKKELQTLEQKRDVIVKLEAERSGPIRFMDGLTDLVVPDKMWLTGLSESKGEMTLTGVAVDNKTVADFMTHLEKARLFGVVDLISTKQINLQERKFMEFTVTCPLQTREPTESSKAA
jgi:type IV pilus assembly protein PilN